MMKFETKEQVDEYLNSDEIECLICGRFFEFLGAHIRDHNVSSEEYREKFGLPLGAPLAGKSYRQKHKEIMLKTHQEGKIKETDPKILKKMAPLAAKAFQNHKAKTKRKNIWKGSGKSLHVQRNRAKEAEKLGDPEPLHKYLQEKEQRKIKKRQQLKSMGFKLTSEVCKEEGITRDQLLRYAKELGVEKINGYSGTYGWTEDNIKSLRELLEKHTRKFIPGLKSVSDMVTLTGINENTVRNWAKKNDVYWYGRETQKHYLFTNENIIAFNNRRKRNGRINPIH
jgi:hypothetical protein